MMITCLHVALLISTTFVRAPPPECTNCGCCVNNRCIDSLASNLKCADGCKDGYWGDRCYNYCNSTCTNCAICHQDKHDGKFYLDSCKNGFFNNMNLVKADCMGKCPDNCLTCSASDACTACKSGYFNVGKPVCDQTCPENCRKKSCNRDDGHCDSCIDGRYGDTCDQKCPQNCQNCSSVLHCELCKAGYYNEVSSRDRTCRNRCPESCFSCTNPNHCTNCSSPFYRGDVCEKCKDGRFGPQCTSTCSSRCADHVCNKPTGACLSCPPDFIGEQCERCEDGRNGTECDKLCSSNCKDNKCNHGSGYCVNGCISNSFQGDTCEVCKKGFYNESCMLRCPGGCENNTCEKSDGRCSFGCKEGYAGPNCDECQTGKYGDNCESACPENCHRHKCDRVIGFRACVMCIFGFYEDNCTERCSDTCIGGSCTQNYGKCYTIVGLAVGGLIAVGIVSLLLAMFLVKRRRRSVETSEHEPTYDQDMTAQSPTYDDLNIPGTSGNDENYDILQTDQELQSSGVTTDAADRPMSNIYVNDRPASEIYENTTV